MVDIEPLLARIALVKELGVTSLGLLVSSLHCHVEPLMERVHLGFEFTGHGDPSRMAAGDLSNEEIVD